MIKDTINSVRLAEEEGEKLINQALEAANNDKESLKAWENEYRKEEISKATALENERMQKVIEQCNNQEEKALADISKKTEELINEASKKIESASDKVIAALC